MSYLLVLAVIISIFYIPVSYNLSFLIDLHTKLIYSSVVNILHFFALPFTFQNSSIVLPNHFIVDIIDDCNAFLPFLLFASAVLVSSEKRVTKFLWIVFGWFAIMLFNMIRILVIVLITNQNKNLFFISHDISTYFFMPLFILTIYWLFLKKNNTLIETPQ